MGCGQSKINLYPRRNKNGSKGHNNKKSGAAEKEADEEEGSAGGVGGAAAPDEADEENEPNKHVLPLVHHPTIEVSESQQDFFKMLDEKIEKGKDYDSSSETELRLEHERRKKLIEQWRSVSQSSQSFQSYPSPPTPARRRASRPLPQPPERQSSPGTVRRYYPTGQQHVPDGMSPPTRRPQSAQPFYAHATRPTNGENWNDPTKSPVKRPQSAGSNWKSNPKGTPYRPKKTDTNDYQKQRDSDVDSDSDVSQITYNPTFQTHSPAHSNKSQQPYIAQIVSYPVSQQVTPPSPPKYIAPPEEYQDPQNNVIDNKLNNTKSHSPMTTVSPPSSIYYIHSSMTTTTAQDLIQQRQQTAFHLQQYVAMKQAQQQMYNYLQRGPHTVFPNMEFGQHSLHNRMYDSDELTSHYSQPTMRPHSAPTPVGVVRPMPPPSPYGPHPDSAHMAQTSMWPHMPPVVSTMGPWSQGQVPPDLQYYPQSQYMPMYRPNSAGSAGTLTRYHKKENNGDVKNNVCQSINIVRQKPIGQIVSIPGQDLTVCNNMSDSPSPASVSTDSGVSPGNSAPSSKTSVFSTPSSNSDTYNSTETKVKTKKSAPFCTRSLKSTKSLDS